MPRRKNLKSFFPRQTWPFRHGILWGMGIILRWHVQAGNIIIPGSKNPDHIKANLDLFDFALTREEMAEIEGLDQEKHYYTSTPEKLKQYETMVPAVNAQK